MHGAQRPVDSRPPAEGHPHGPLGAQRPRLPVEGLSCSGFTGALNPRFTRARLEPAFSLFPIPDRAPQRQSVPPIFVSLTRGPRVSTSRLSHSSAPSRLSNPRHPAWSEFGVRISFGSRAIRLSVLPVPCSGTLLGNTIERPPDCGYAGSQHGCRRPHGDHLPLRALARPGVGGA